MFKYLNVKNIVNKQEKDLNKFILDNDSRYRGQLFTLADKILSKKGVQMVLLAGPSCAGKTTTANLLKQILELKGRTVDVMSMDDFFIDLDKRKLLPNGQQDFDSPEILNYKLMSDCFTRYFAGEDVYFPEYNFKESKCELNKKHYKYKYNSIIIFEGLHVLNPYILNNLSETNYYTIYVNAISNFKSKIGKMNTTDIRLLRRIIRDIGRRGNSIDSTLKTWEQVCEAERKYINPYIKNAQEVVDTTHEYELGIFQPAFNEIIEENKSYAKKLKFYGVFNSVQKIERTMLPDTTLMWEFVDIPKVEKVKVKKEKINDIEEISYES